MQKCKEVFLKVSISTGGLILLYIEQTLLKNTLTPPYSQKDLQLSNV